MTISANTVFEVRTGGSDNNGGGFVTGASGTDYSLQNAAQATLTTASDVHTTTTQINVDAGDYTVVANDVGNLLQITGGTATAGVYEITAADTGNNRWTLDRSAGTAGQTVAGAMGGAFASPGKAAASMTVDLNRTWVRAGTYTITTSTPGAAGPVLMTNNIDCFMEGYSSTRGDRAGRPVLSAGAVTSVDLFEGLGNGNQIFIHLKADGNSQTGVNGFACDNNPRWATFDCHAVNCDQGTSYGFSASYLHSVVSCYASNCVRGFRGSGTRCWADACVDGFDAGTSWVECLATDCTDEGFGNCSTGSYIACTAEGNGGDGFDNTTSGNQSRFLWCVATNNGGYGFRTGTYSMLEECADYNNTSGRTNGSLYMFDNNPINLTGDPWEDASSDDYRPNNTAGAGAALRNIAGDVGGSDGQTDNRDIGAVQHTDPAGGGGGGGAVGPLVRSRLVV